MNHEERVCEILEHKSSNIFPNVILRQQKGEENSIVVKIK